MASPITWRNVGTPNVSGDNDLYQSGSAAVGRGFDRLAKVAGQIEQNRFDQVADTRDANTQQFLTRLQDVRNPESLLGVEQNMRNQIGSMNARDIDAAKVDQALQARLGQRANNLITSGQFDQAEDFIGQAGINDKSKLNTSLAAGRQAEADAQHQQKIEQDKFKMQDLYNQALTGAGSRQEVRGRLGQLIRDNNIDPSVSKGYTSKALADYDAMEKLSPEMKAKLETSKANITTGFDNQIEQYRNDPNALQAQSLQEKWDGYTINDSRTQYGDFETFVQNDAKNDDGILPGLFNSNVEDTQAIIKDVNNALLSGRGPDDADPATKEMYKTAGEIIGRGDIPESYIESAKIRAYNRSRQTDAGQNQLGTKFEDAYRDELLRLTQLYLEAEEGKKVLADNKAKINTLQLKKAQTLTNATDAMYDASRALRQKSYR